VLRLLQRADEGSQVKVWTHLGDGLTNPHSACCGHSYGAHGPHAQFECCIDVGAGKQCPCTHYVPRASGSEPCRFPKCENPADPRWGGYCDGHGVTDVEAFHERLEQENEILRAQVAELQGQLDDWHHNAMERSERD